MPSGVIQQQCTSQDRNIEKAKTYLPINSWTVQVPQSGRFRDFISNCFRTTRCFAMKWPNRCNPTVNAYEIIIKSEFIFTVYTTSESCITNTPVEAVYREHYTLMVIANIDKRCWILRPMRKQHLQQSKFPRVHCETAGLKRVCILGCKNVPDRSLP